ncbi:MAG: HEAT repeat domain-containing protein [Planctomycetota bacterium]|nr:HEAT repeat domain-containing protein [Planctomycetota bacterium]
MGSVKPAGSDLFQREEPKPKTSKSTVLVWQFFLFPLLIVVAALGVFLLFGAFAKDTDTPQELLERVRSGGSNQQAQAAHQLALLVRDEYDKQKANPKREPPFYAQLGFREGLVEAMDKSLNENASVKRQELLAIMIGLTQAEDGIDSLLRALYPEGRRNYDDDVRFGAALGLVYFEGRAAQSALARVVLEERDDEIRAVAVTGLVKLARAPGEEDPAVVRALRRGLEARHPGVKVQSACGLGVRGLRMKQTVDGGEVDRVAQIVGQALTREGLAELGIGERFQPGALRNASRAAAVLGDAELKQKVERLTKSDLEGDESVRQVAREALKRWGATTAPKED